MDDPLHVRDKRANNRYFIDNALLRGGWGDKLGPHAIAVYNAIALHADNETQTAYPSYGKIAELTGMSARQVPREIEKLAEYRIIHVDSRLHERKPAIITLLDKAEWIPVNQVTGSHMTGSHMTGSQETYDRESYEHMTGSHANNTHDNNTQGTKPNGGETSARDYLSDVLAHSQKPDQSGIADPSQDIAAFMETSDEFIATYRKRTGLWPEKQVQKPAIQALAENGADLELWDQVVTAWVKVGWSKKNVAGMIDCYERGEVPSTRKNGGKHGNRHNEKGSRVRSDSLSEQQRASLRNL